MCGDVVCGGKPYYIIGRLIDWHPAHLARWVSRLPRKETHAKLPVAFRSVAQNEPDSNTGQPTANLVTILQ